MFTFVIQKLYKEFMSSKTFRGGVHPKEYKELTEHLAFEYFPAPDEIILPLSQHLGKEAKPLVKKGDEVILGQLVAQPDGFISAPIHSSVNGKVLSIGKEVTPLGFPKDSIVIKASENSVDKKFTFPPLDPETITPDEIRQRVAEAGIVGQGGAAFPTYVKLSPPKDKVIDVVIINGCECEPYLNCDYRLMLEQPEKIIKGLKLIMKAVSAQRGLIVVEDNKSDAAQKLSELVNSDEDIDVKLVKTKYPQGSEKHLIKAVLGREVPSGALPFEVGAYVQNVQTAIALCEAFWEGKPLTERVLTVSGEAIKNPKNLRVKLGTPAKNIIEFAGGFTEEPDKIIFGGPMTGFALFDLSVPVVKGTSGILALKVGEIEAADRSNECLRCGRCIDACPVFLLPVSLADLMLVGDVDGLERKGSLDCIECGCCAYSCPTRRPLVQMIRFAKSQVLARKKK